MALYEIRTLMTRQQISLISYGDFPSDLAAILAARTLIRSGEALEVRRGNILVYRLGPAKERSATSPKVRRGQTQPPETIRRA